MTAQGFSYSHQVLDDPIYRAQVLDDLLEDMRKYSTLQLKFDFYQFFDGEPQAQTSSPEFRAVHLEAAETTMI